MDFGEEVENALIREVREELGVTEFKPVFIHRYKFVSNIEAELVNSFYTIYNGPFTADPEEISEIRFWKIEDILKNIGNDVFTPNFEDEFMNLYKLNLLPLKV